MVLLRARVNELLLDDYLVPGREGVEVFNNKALYASFSLEVFQDPALFSVLR